MTTYDTHGRKVESLEERKERNDRWQAKEAARVSALHAAWKEELDVRRTAEAAAEKAKRRPAVAAALGWLFGLVLKVLSLVFFLPALVAFYAAIASIIHFQILAAVGFLMLSGVCLLLGAGCVRCGEEVTE